MKRIIALFSCLTIIFCFTACKKEDNPTIIGTWTAEVDNNIIFQFEDDGIVYMSEDGGENEMPAKYTFDGEKIEFEMTSFYGKENAEFKVISLDEEEMIIEENGVEQKMIKTDLSIIDN